MPQTLTLRQLNRATLARQGLLAPLPSGSVADHIEQLGSLQAQHPDWPPFALQSRLRPDATPADLNLARRRRRVVRASLMRITVHVVSATDFWPMSTLTLPLRANQFRAGYKLDPLTSPLGKRITAAHPQVLAAMREEPLPISEIEAILGEQLKGVTIPPSRSLWRHFSGAVQLVQVPFDGEAYGRARYVPAVEWLRPATDSEADPDRAAVHLAERYLAAYGPATADDLAAYVGRGREPGRWRVAFEALQDRVVELESDDGRRLIDLQDAPRPVAETPAPPRLLARWDSLLLAYGTKDRARVLPPENQATVITRNADVLPTFLIDGFVAGTWLPRTGVDGPRIELRPFRRLAATDRDALEAEASRLLPILARGAFSRNPGTD